MAIGALALDCGVTLPAVVQRVSVYGDPEPEGGNVVLVCHALTGSSRALDWWDGLVGPGKPIDTNVLAVVCVNALGSCYGSTGPTSLAPSGDAYGADFPLVTPRDIVRAQRAALDALGFERFAAVVGASLGGMLALEWTYDAPRRIGRAIVIGAYDHFSAMGIALNAVAREAIRIARTPAEGIGLARKIAMLTYKSEALFAERFARNPDRTGGDPHRHATDRFDVEGYLDYQGARFAQRMDAQSYLTLTRAMDLFDIRLRAAPERLPPATFVGIASDWLFLPRDIRAAAERYASSGARAKYLELVSDHGHDAFLAEPERLGALLAPALAGLYATASS